MGIYITWRGYLCNIGCGCIYVPFPNLRLSRLPCVVSELALVEHRRGWGGALCVEARTPSPSRAPGDCLPSFFLGAYTRDGVDSWRVGFLQMWMERVSWQPGTSAGTGQACAQRPVVKSRVWPALGWRCFLWPLGKGWWWLPGSQVPVPGLDVPGQEFLASCPCRGESAAWPSVG